MLLLSCVAVAVAVRTAEVDILKASSPKHFAWGWFKPSKWGYMAKLARERRCLTRFYDMEDKCWDALPVYAAGLILVLSLSCCCCCCCCCCCLACCRKRRPVPRDAYGRELPLGAY